MVLYLCLSEPAAATGIYSFKPTAGRVPYDGINVLILPDGWTGVQSTQGPMARSVDDLELYMKLMCDAEPWHKEPGITVKSWVPSKGPGRKLRVGIMRDNGVVAPVEAISRALETAVNKLKKDGNFEIVEFEPFESARAWDIIKKIYWPDGGAMVMEHLERSGEEIRPLTKWIIEQSGNAGRKLSTEELFSLVSQRDDFRTRLAAHWAKSIVDVILTPVGPTPAPAHGTAKYWNYTCYWNLANYPAGVFPTGLFCDTSDTHDSSIKPRNDTEKDIWDSYDPAVQAGAPLCLQVVGQMGYEEDTMWAMRQIVNAVHAA